jgi:hypothetical protein
MISEPNSLRRLYRKLLRLYPSSFRERLGESMEHTFEDLYRERRQQRKDGWSGFALWIFAETAIGIVKEHVLLWTQGDTMKSPLAIPRSTALISAVLLAVTLIIAPGIYLMGNLRDPLGPFGYDVADFLSGPVLAGSLVVLIFTLRERIGPSAPRRMSLAMLAAMLAAATMILIACVRSANRHYHLAHPELHLEESQMVLTVWTTLIAGLTGAGWHFLGWALVLIGSTGWTTRRLPPQLSVLYLVTGAISWFVYLLPDLEGLAGILVIVVSIWQGILLWRGEPEDVPAPEILTGGFDQA